MLQPPTPVDLESRIAEPGERADVREPARAATGEDDSERALREAARDPVDAGREGAARAEHVVGPGRRRVEPAADRARRGVDENQLASGQPRHAGAGLAACDGDQAVALPAGERAPGRVGAVHEHDVAERRLGGVERVRVVVRAEAFTVDRRDRSPRRERPLQLADEPPRVPARPDDGEDGRSRLGQAEAAARLQLARELSGDREREAAVRLDEPDEVLRVELQQPRVAQRPHRGRARRAGQEPQFAERGAAPHLAQDAPVVAGEHLQAAGDDDEEPVGRITGAEEPLPRRQLDRAPPVAQLIDRARRRASQHRRLAQSVAGRDCRHESSLRWPREELNLRTQVRSLPLCPLSYGAADGQYAPRLRAILSSARWR